MNLKFSKILIIAIIFLNFKTNISAKTLPSSFADLAEKLIPSVVNISTTQTITTNANPFPFQFPPGSPFEDMFKDFDPIPLACLRKYTTLLPHVAEVTQKFQKQGIKIGSSTGFVRSMVDILEEDAEKQGYSPDASVAGDEVINGARPKPFMVYRNLDLMNVHPIQSVVKVDDTVSGVGEALEAGCWGVGIARYSNYMDMDTLEEAGSLPEEEIQRRLIKTREILQKAGSHYVIDTFDQLVDVVDDINLRLSRG